MIPREWNEALAAGISWQQAYDTVERAVKVLFAHNPIFTCGTHSTEEVVEALYPMRFAIGDGIYARQRIFKALFALADHGLMPYVTRGPATTNAFHKTKRPYLWSRPHSIPEPGNREVILKLCDAMARAPEYLNEIDVAHHVQPNGQWTGEQAIMAATKYINNLLDATEDA